jgi:hypothetical protein
MEQSPQKPLKDVRQNFAARTRTAHLNRTKRTTDKPRQGVVANILKLRRNGGVGFIDWLDGRLTNGVPDLSSRTPSRGIP